MNYLELFLQLLLLLREGLDERVDFVEHLVDLGEETFGALGLVEILVLGGSLLGEHEEEKYV